MVERRLIKEPYFWYAQEVIAGTHNRKGNICCAFIDRSTVLYTKNKHLLSWFVFEIRLNLHIPNYGLKWRLGPGIQGAKFVSQ